MKLIKTFAVIAATFTLAGCVTEQVVWDKPGVTPVAFEQDKNQCVYEAKLGTPGTMIGGTRGATALLMANTDQIARTKDLQASCMQARGYAKRTVQAEQDPHRQDKAFGSDQSPSALPAVQSAIVER